jgi:hypothetical protein
MGNEDKVPRILELGNRLTCSLLSKQISIREETGQVPEQLRMVTRESLPP